MSSQEQVFKESEAAEALEALYRPGFYAEGEALCLEILEELAPEWEPARLFLLLNLAAQNLPEDALEMVDELDDDSIFEALRHLTFGAGTPAESLVYDDLLECARERGLSQELTDFFAQVEKPMARQDLFSSLQTWD